MLGMVVIKDFWEAGTRGTLGTQEFMEFMINLDNIARLFLKTKQRNYIWKSSTFSVYEHFIKKS